MRSPSSVSSGLVIWIGGLEYQVSLIGGLGLVLGLPPETQGKWPVFENNDG